MFAKVSSSLSRAAFALLLLPLAGCQQFDLLDPKGPIGVEEKGLILQALGYMLLVVIPVILLTLWFAWRYRASNTNATYAPKWAHSAKIEATVWIIPCIIVGILGVMIWRTSHTLDPYRPLDSQVTPVRVDVVSLNWKWLFIYPDYGVASVNQLAIPTGTPINFRLTSESIMNSFFIPRLGTQVYTMAGMQTKLHLIADEAGTYRGMSASFSGPGFADMHFNTLAMDKQAFQQWIAKAHQSSVTLDPQTYAALVKPSRKDPVTLYGNVTPHLFKNIVDTFMAPMAPKKPSTALNHAEDTHVASAQNVGDNR